MRSAGPITTDIVLLGAGHAHVEVLRRFALRPERGVRLTLIAREPHTPYSGMLPGLLRGDYGFDAAHIDLAPLAGAAAARLILAEADGIDLTARTVSVAGRPSIPFDLLSLDVGGVPLMPAGAGIPVKPIGRFLDRLSTVEAKLPQDGRIAVVGGGAGGTELALALARRFGARVRIALIAADAEPLAEAPRRARAIVEGALAEAGVELVCGARAEALADGRLVLSDGRVLDTAFALWATGVVGPGFLAGSGLACDDSGCARVGRDLRSISHPFVFAAGDCASLIGAPRPKAGVWAVRAGVPLAANLRRTVRGRATRQWRPQAQALVILGLGNGRAVAWRNGIAASGRLVWRWKDWIDRRWMRMYAMRMDAPVTEQEAAMRCAGCGGKVSAEALAGVLAGLPTPPRSDVLLGIAGADDAAIVQPPPGRAVVQSVDHFRDFLGDPFLFGQIAAAHALSDIYAMGARPWTALAIATVPYAPGGRMGADLAAMMQGAAQVLEADGCALVGGHSGEGAEATLGFAVSGLVEPRRAWRKSGLRTGDALVLTKPIGTGVILAGQMRGLTKARWLQAAVASMCRTNAEAARILRAHGVLACTDVTGFGLAGHLAEMLRGSALSARLYPSEMRLLPGALELAQAGVESTLAPENRRLLEFSERGPLIDLLNDPQTSGGLLAGVSPTRAGACVAALRAAGLEAAIIGTVEPALDEAPKLLLQL
jgi:selenide,water dikinase